MFIFQNGNLLSFVNRIKFLLKNTREFFTVNNYENLEKLRQLLVKWSLQIKKIYFCLICSELELFIELKKYNVFYNLFIYKMNVYTSIILIAY